MAINPLSTFSTKPAFAQRSINLVEEGLALHYRHDIPGELEASVGLSHHLLTFFLTPNSRQVTRIEGQGEYDGPMMQGDFYLYPAGISGCTSWHAIDKTFHVVLDPGLLRRVAVETDCINPERIELLPTLKSRDRAIENLVQLFLAELDHADSAQKLYLQSLTHLFTVHLLRRYCTQAIALRTYEGGLSQCSLRQVLDYIQAFLDQDLSLEILANLVNISKFHFIDLFKQSMGMTPHQYVTQQRIERAKELLRGASSARLGDRALSIAEIGLACGFANQSHFTRLFRRHTGATPKDYRG